MEEAVRLDRPHATTRHGAAPRAGAALKAATGPVVVVGAGLSGLSAVIHLASRGREAVVIEAHDEPGDCCGSASLGPYRFDTGPSVLTMPDVLADTLAAAGEDIENSLPPPGAAAFPACIPPECTPLPAWASRLPSSPGGGPQPGSWKAAGDRAVGSALSRGPGGAAGRGRSTCPGFRRPLPHPERGDAAAPEAARGHRRKAHVPRLFSLRAPARGDRRAVQEAVQCRFAVPDGEQGPAALAGSQAHGVTGGGRGQQVPREDHRSPAARHGRPRRSAAGCPRTVRTLITHARTDAARFLGYEITVQHNSTKTTRRRRTVNGQIMLRVPLEVIRAKCAPYLHRGKPAKQTALTNGSDYTIVATYGAVYRGIVQYYLLAGDVFRLHRMRWVMETSMLKTLAGKHRSSVSKMAAKHKAKIQTPHGPRTCFEAHLERPGRQPLVARFGGTPLHRQRSATVTDRQPIRVDYPHKELLTRLLADTCEICQRTGEVQVHHVCALKDLGAPGPLQPQWAKAMANRRRKTLVVCTACHDQIHHGQPATPLTQ
jgi:hypothetical protein